MTSMRSALSRARNLGAAKSGVNTWKMERLTSIALVPLTLWFIYFIVSVAGVGYAGYVDAVSQPGNTTLLTLFLFTAFYHGYLGLEVIIEDYVHHHFWNAALRIFVRFWAVAMGAFCIISVLMTAFSG